MRGQRQRDYICSFCGKTQDQVLRMIAGSGFVYVCDKCVEQASKGEQGVALPRCSFCGKTEDRVEYIYGGPKQVGICDDCVTRCQEIMAEERARKATTQPGNGG